MCTQSCKWDFFGNHCSKKGDRRKGPATDLEPGTYTLSRSFNHELSSQPQILRPPSPYVSGPIAHGWSSAKECRSRVRDRSLVLFLLSSFFEQWFPKKSHLQHYTCSHRISAYTILLWCLLQLYTTIYKGFMSSEGGLLNCWFIQIHRHTNAYMNARASSYVYVYMHKHTWTRVTLPPGLSTSVGQALAMPEGRHLTPS